MNADDANPVKSPPPESKTIRQLIAELSAFEEPAREVRLSRDRGETHHPISLVAKEGPRYCLLITADPGGYPTPTPEWVTRGKNIGQLTTELRTFEDLGREVRLSFDETGTHRPIGLIASLGLRYCLLIAEPSCTTPV